MNVTSIYPVVQTHDVATTARWWRMNFGFDVAFEADWYVSLRRDSWELAVLDADHETIPTSHRGSTAQGLLINIEVDDVDAEWHRLTVAGDATVALEIRSEAFGQRHFIVRAPDGVLVDVIQEIEPSAEYAAAFSD